MIFYDLSPAYIFNNNSFHCLSISSPCRDTRTCQIALQFWNSPSLDQHFQTPHFLLILQKQFISALLHGSFTHLQSELATLLCALRAHCAYLSSSTCPSFPGWFVCLLPHIDFYELCGKGIVSFFFSEYTAPNIMTSTYWWCNKYSNKCILFSIEDSYIS